MNPDLSILLKDWLHEQNGEWKHTDEISWENGKTKGEIHSKTHGFIRHPLSQNLSEVLWIGAKDVWVPPITQELSHLAESNIWLLAADPEFFEKLAKSMNVLADVFKRFPDRNVDYTLTVPTGDTDHWIIKYTYGS